MASVLLPLAKGFEELEAVALIDVMRRGGIDVQVAYLEDELQDNLVLGANGITIYADISLYSIISDDFDMIVLPGGWDGTRMPWLKIQGLLNFFRSLKQLNQ